MEWVTHRLNVPTDDDVLIDDERVWYRSGRHWMSLWRHAVEALAAVQLLAWLYVTPPFGARTLTLILSVASIVFMMNWFKRQSSTELARAITLIGLVTLFSGYGVTALPLVTMAFFVGRFLRRLVIWKWYRILYVTDRRIIETHGIFNRSLATMPLGRVTDVSLRISALGDYFHYGEFRLETAGQNQALGRLDFLVDPDKFNRVVLGLATNPKTFGAGY